MNVYNLIIISILGIGGFTAAAYETVARKNYWPVGEYYLGNGLMTIIGGFVTFGAIVFSAIVNTWWTLFIVAIGSWFLSQVLIQIFKSSSQIVAPLLIVVAAALIAVYVI